MIISWSMWKWRLCMPSSRIVQAHGAIQLFVQRCLMGLEPKAAADVEQGLGAMEMDEELPR